MMSRNMWSMKHSTVALLGLIGTWMICCNPIVQADYGAELSALRQKMIDRGEKTVRNTGSRFIRRNALSRTNGPSTNMYSSTMAPSTNMYSSTMAPSTNMYSSTMTPSTNMYSSTMAPSTTTFCPAPIGSTRRLKASTSKSTKKSSKSKSAKSLHPTPIKIKKTKTPVSSKSKKGSNKSKKTKSKKGSQDIPPHFDVVFRVDAQLGTICGDGPSDILSSDQKSIIEDTFLDIVAANDDVTIGGVNVVDFTESTCCDTGCGTGTKTNMSSNVVLTIPVRCDGECPTLIIPDMIEGDSSEAVINSMLDDSGIYENGADATVTVNTQELTDVDDECVRGNAKCEGGSLCCGVGPGCTCEFVSETYCGTFGCTMDPAKGCCVYSVCDGV